MAGDREVLESGYQAFNRGDIDAIVENFEDDIEFVGPNSQRMPGAGKKPAITVLPPDILARP